MNALTRSILRALEGGGRRAHAGLTALYRLFNRARQQRYIGITNNVERRMQQHSETKGWWSEIDETLTQLTWYPTRMLAARAEVHAIRTAGVPLYNVEHNPRHLRMYHRGGIVRQQPARVNSGVLPMLGLCGSSAGVLAGHVVGWWSLSPGWLVVALAITGLSGALVRKGLR